MNEEETIDGGMDPDASVVRIGDTVRRPRGGSSDAVRALLLHLATVGFEGAPQYLGVDEQGRDVLTFIDGDVSSGRAARGSPDWSAQSAPSRTTA